jgi:hypothetical protein
MRGNITRRGEQSWRIRFDVGRTGGKRVTHAHTFRGSRKEAQQKLAELLASVGQGAYVEPRKLSVAAFVRARVDQWEAAGDVTARTAQRYRQLTEKQIAPHLGATLLQKLSRLDVEGWHTTLRKAGLAARTIGHAHRVLGKALRDAERDGLVLRNVCKLQKAPRVADTEMTIVRDLPDFVAKLRDTRLYVPAMVALFALAARGDPCAALEPRRPRRQDHRGARGAGMDEGLRHPLQGPQVRAGRRDVTLPDILVDVLREHRKAALELRMQFGLGRLPDDGAAAATEQRLIGLG